MANSSDLSAAADLLAAQYNNLRLDVLDPATGHDHSGAADHGVYIGGIPVGGIFMWAGSLGSLPSGYQICDGTNGTPDLRDKIVIGAGSTYAVGATGGATTKDVSHVHASTGLSLAAEASHTHSGGTLSSSNDGAHDHIFESMGPDGSFYGGAGYGHSVSTPADHTHSVPTGATAAGSSHTHTLSGNTGSSGSATQDIMPPFHALYFVMRIS